MIQLLFALLSTLSSASAESPVRWEELRGWRALGTRWAAGLDDSGGVLAIYDLAFPGLAGPVTLGRVGERKLGLDEVVDVVKRARAVEFQDEDPAPPELLSKLPETREFPAGWWKDVAWARSVVISDWRGPERFTLDDIDFGAVVKDQKEFRATIAKLEAFREVDEGDEPPVLGRDFMARFEFVRLDAGGYELHWKGLPAGLAAANERRPRKVADLRAVRSGLGLALGWDVLDNLSDVAVGLIPVPVVSALLGTALNRFFIFREELVLLHLSMASEMIDTAEEGEARFNPFASLSRDERIRAAKYGQLSDSTITTVWRWVWKRPEASWRKTMKEDLERSAASTRWLHAHGEEIAPLNARFALSKAPSGQRRLELLARKHRKTRRPIAALDYDNLTLRRQARQSVEALSIIMDFSSRFIPWVGGLVYQAYAQFAERPIRLSQHWEARLSAHLEQRQAEAGEDWKRELEVLDQQSLNPFQVSRARQAELIQLRLDELRRLPRSMPTQSRVEI